MIPTNSPTSIVQYLNSYRTPPASAELDPLPHAASHRRETTPFAQSLTLDPIDHRPPRRRYPPIAAAATATTASSVSDPSTPPSTPARRPPPQLNLDEVVPVVRWKWGEPNPMTMDENKLLIHWMDDISLRSLLSWRAFPPGVI